ncbi:MAG: O-antigen ligase family protein [Phycisphaerae bacterium]|nr:O-antigen ligase family protein [Phycisphaerae bacterium]
MFTLGQQKIEPVSLSIMVVLSAVALVIGIVWPELLPWVVAITAGMVLLVAWAVEWDVTLWAWMWVLSYGLLNWPEWKIVIPGFFNLNPPRIILGVAFFVFLINGFMSRRRIRFNRGIIWAMLAMTIYVAASAQVFGWTAQAKAVVTAPYFRFFGSILFPFIAFFMLYNVRINENHIRRGLILLTIYGWYSLYIAYLQYAVIRGASGAASLIWPSYILDPSHGIHFDRARGAFPSAPPQAIFVVMLFFVDMYLIRKLRGPYRVALVFQAIFTIPAIYFTLLRSAYVSFLVCGAVWIIWANRGRFRWTKLGLLILLVVVGVYASWDRLATRDRMAGGVAQMTPIEARKVLVYQTWEIFKEHPVFGVGFGHFVDAKIASEKDPADLASMYTEELVQHNLFLNMLAETGIIGLVLTVMVFVLLFRQSLQLYRKIPPGASGIISRDFVVLFWVVFADYLMDATFRDPLWAAFSNGLLWTFGGLIVCLNRMLEPQPLELPIVSQDITV